MERQGVAWVETGARVAYVVMGVGAVCVAALALGLLGPLTDAAFLILGAGRSSPLLSVFGAIGPPRAGRG